ncbi:adenylate kinase 7-like [Dysidea avara]|uniref:adenylate kinase 7-like n=1 Tax=Dysidea avara TaxID=196820 RepID=UPI00332D4DB9
MVRVFVNHVDTYKGKAISKVFSSSVIGASLEEENEDTQPPADNVSASASGQNVYEVIGTFNDKTSEKPSWVTEIIPHTDNPSEFLPVLLTCDIIIYDVTWEQSQTEEASWAIQALHDHLSDYTTPKIFICLSTVLTWAKSKPLDPDDPEVPFTEEDYRRRRNHPNFSNQNATEKLVIKLGKTDKNKLFTYVVASGLTYGLEEEVFHFFFKASWHGEIPALPVFGDGQNVIPTIHILDLASILVNAAESKPKVRYLVAVDDSHSTLEEVVRAVSTNLGTEKVTMIPAKDGLLIKDISQYDYDHLTVNLRIETNFVKESMQVNWKAQSGLVENISDVIKEYKEERDLIPIKVCILGPPQVGKSTVVAKLCKHYKLHHIHAADVIRQHFEKLERQASRADEDDDNEESDDQAQAAQEMLELFKEDKDQNSGRLSDQYIIQFYKERLLSMPCQNQGFILDGFPKTYEQAKELFAPQEEVDDTDQDATPVNYNQLIMPDVVVSLTATDDFLKQRVINLPESVISGTHNNEEGFMRRLTAFREQNEEDDTVLNYFDELEIHPDAIDASAKSEEIVEKIKKLVGEPRNYGLTPEEKAEMERKAQEELLRQQQLAEEERERQEAAEKDLREQRKAEWNEHLAKVQQEEQEMLETQSIPLRNYLMKHVMPTLTQGLIEVCKVRPDDAVDYLAEYLFKHNPQID